MSLACSTPAHDDSIQELAGAALDTLCLAALLAGWAWLFVAASRNWSFATNASAARGLAPPGLLTAAGALGLVPRRLRLAWRSTLFLLGLGCTALLGYLWLSSTVSLYYLALVVIAAGLLVGARASFAVALGLTVALLAVHLLGAGCGGATVALPAVGLMWATALTSWLSSHSLYTTLRWALQSQERAGDLLAQLRQRQGELNRTLEALTEASRRLERTNQELTIARQRAEEARALKEQFVANVSHELRTPLNLIVGFAEMMYLSPESYAGVSWTPTLEGDIHEIYHASRHLQSLVDDVLDLSRIDAARLPMLRELQDVRAIIADAAETIRPLLRQHGLSYRAECPEQLPQLFVDRTRIRQVLLNLLNNAVRYTDKGGITVTVGLTPEAVVVGVHDTGVGIAPDQLESVFEKFRQVDGGLRRSGGAGLGLALSRQFVELHGGRMWAESQVGQGSTFYFSLPLPGAVPQTTQLQQIPARPRLDVPGGPVVVVDPDPTISEMLSRYLDGCRLLPATSVAEAEALITSEHPLAVIVNQPPQAPDGEWLRPLGEQSRRHNVPVLRCSLPSPSWLRQANSFDGCLCKPVSRQALQHVLARHCPGPCKVLVVDDDPGFVRLMARLLGASDHVQEVSCAYSGAQALELARDRLPDLVLLDLLMPEVDGFEVLRALRADSDLGGTVVIAVTATSYAEEALLRQGTLLTLAQPAGSPGTTVELLNAVLRIVRPNYAGEESSRASA